MKRSRLPKGRDNLLLSVDLGYSPPLSQQMKKQKNNCEAPAAWRPPLMVEPREEEEPLSLIDLGKLDTDAKLYVIKENTSNGEEKIHSLLQMPSCLSNLDKRQNSYLFANSYNLLMIDVSGSMGSYWSHLILGWNQYVAPFLIGRTSLFVFGTDVTLKRSGPIIQEKDFDGSRTNLTGALQTIVNEVYQCKERYIKVFLITDGDHNATLIRPETVIQQMCSPDSKKCDVFVLGAGNAFPVQYSINIRSRLHNGSANIPSLFWARGYTEIEEQMKEIGSKISDGTSQILRLSVAGFSLPEGEAKYTFHPKEWVYFPRKPERIKQLALGYQNIICHILLQPCQIQLSVLNEVFRQWNSIIIQMHYKKEVIPSDILPFMERLFNTTLIMEEHSNSKSSSIRERLARKDFNTCTLEFKTLLNKIRAILITAKFSNELELAENILSATVGGGKYETKVLQMKGHTDEEYAKDCEEFMKIYKEQKTRIQDIGITPEDCCRITLSCTVSDLQDSDFPMMMNLNKFEFLKQFTISGIPVYAPSRDSVAINPWSFGVHALVNAPYTIMSQVAIELYADLNPEYKLNKDVQLKWDSLKTHFNAIVPVFSPDVAKVMGPLVHTRLYSMCSTFAILKNPHIIDFNIHMAALGVTWVRILFEHPTQPRPEFVNLRIKSIEATAALYLNRPSYTKYWQVLISDTAQALMTESTLTIESKTIKCESLIKPMFILHLHQRSDENPQDASVVVDIMRMILIEYIGRCLSHYKTNEKNNSTPFTDFFAQTLTDQELKEWVQKYTATTKENMAGSEGLLLEDFYTMEKVQKAARKIALAEVRNLKEKLTTQIPIAVDLKKVERLRNVSLAGDMSWFTLQIFAREVGLMEEVIDNLFSEQSLFVYTAHALQYRASRERLITPVADYEALRTLVTKRVQQENSRIIAKDLSDEIVQQMKGAWLQAYLNAHREVVQPMTRQQIIAEASGQGVEVTNATFEQVYRKYRLDVGLLGNACQCRDCPFFLIPNRSYNQHLSVERRGSAAFPHGFHRAAYRFRDSDLSTVISHIVSGIFNTPVPYQSVQPYRDKLAELKDTYKKYV